MFLRRGRRRDVEETTRHHDNVHSGDVRASGSGTRNTHDVINLQDKCVPIYFSLHQNANTRRHIPERNIIGSELTLWQKSNCESETNKTQLSDEHNRTLKPNRTEQHEASP